jgi:hypothetical protein
MHGLPGWTRSHASECLIAGTTISLGGMLVRILNLGPYGPLIGWLAKLSLPVWGNHPVGRKVEALITVR